jgi:hypothetical protein
MTNKTLSVRVDLTPELRERIDGMLDEARKGMQRRIDELTADNERLARQAREVIEEAGTPPDARETVRELRENVRALADNWSKEQMKSEGLGEKVDELGKRRTVILHRDAQGDWSITDYNAVRDQATDKLEPAELLFILASMIHSEPGQCRHLSSGYSTLRDDFRHIQRANGALRVEASAATKLRAEYEGTLADQQRRLEHQEAAITRLQKLLEEANARVLFVKRETEFAELPPGDYSLDIRDADPDVAIERDIDTPFFGGESFVVHRREPDAIKIDEGAIVALANMQPGEKFTVVSALRGLAAFCDNAPAVVGSVLLKGGVELRVVDYLRTLDGSTFPTWTQAVECAASVKEKTGNECTQVTIGGGFVLPWKEFAALAQYFDHQRNRHAEVDADLQRMSRELQELGAVNSTVDDLRDLPHDARVDRVNWCEAYRMWINRSPAEHDQDMPEPPRPAGLVLKSDTVQGNAEPMSDADLEAAAAAEGFGLVAETIEQTIDAEVAQAFEQGGDPTATSWLSAGYPLFQPGTHSKDAEAVFELLGNAKLPLRWLLSIEPAALAEVHAWATGQVEPSPELVRVVLLSAEQLAHEKVAFNIDTGVPHYDAAGRCRIEETLRMLGYVVPQGDAQLWSGALCLALDEYIDAKVDTAAPDVFTARYPREAWGLVDMTAAGGSDGLAEIAPGIVSVSAAADIELGDLVKISADGARPVVVDGDMPTVPDATDDELLERQTAGLAEIKAYLDANPEVAVIGVDMAREGTESFNAIAFAGALPPVGFAGVVGDLNAEACDGKGPDCEGCPTEAEAKPVRNIVQAMEQDTDGDDCAP